jgi:exosome complex component RRP42
MNQAMKKHLLSYYEKGLRFDGRNLLQYRDIQIEYNISKSAEGSARVKIGDTEVLVGIKMELGKPYPDSPDEGTIIVGAELYALSSPKFESGPPGIGAIELARVVDRGLRESHALDFRKLCYKAGEKVWLLVIDICTLNDAGNLFDASALAALAALKVARFPKVLENGQIDYKELTDQKVELEKIPISITVLKIDNKFVVDPTNEEEEVIDARLTVATTEDGTICALQKGGNMALTEKDIDTMLQIGIDKGKELRQYVMD